MNLLILSHKPPYPVIDGGCHAMDRFIRDLLKTFPAAKIHYICIATQKHRFQVDESTNGEEIEMNYTQILLIALHFLLLKYQLGSIHGLHLFTY